MGIFYMYHDDPPMTPDAVYAECKKRTNHEVKVITRKYEAYRKTKNNLSHYDANPRLVFHNPSKREPKGKPEPALR